MKCSNCQSSDNVAINGQNFCLNCGHLIMGPTVQKYAKSADRLAGEAQAAADLELQKLGVKVAGARKEVTTGSERLESKPATNFKISPRIRTGKASYTALEAQPKQAAKAHGTMSDIKPAKDLPGSPISHATKPLTPMRPSRSTESVKRVAPAPRHGLSDLVTKASAAPLSLADALTWANQRKVRWIGWPAAMMTAILIMAILSIYSNHAAIKIMQELFGLQRHPYVYGFSLLAYFLTTLALNNAAGAKLTTQYAKQADARGHNPCRNWKGFWPTLLLELTSITCLSALIYSAWWVQTALNSVRTPLIVVLCLVVIIYFTLGVIFTRALAKPVMMLGDLSPLSALKIGWWAYNSNFVYLLSEGLNSMLVVGLTWLIVLLIGFIILLAGLANTNYLGVFALIVIGSVAMSWVLALSLRICRARWTDVYRKLIYDHHPEFKAKLLAGRTSTAGDRMTALACLAVVILLISWGLLLQRSGFVLTLAPF